MRPRPGSTFYVRNRHSAWEAMAQQSAVVRLSQIPLRTAVMTVTTVTTVKTVTTPAVDDPSPCQGGLRKLPVRRWSR